MSESHATKPALEIHGAVAPGFEPVLTAFEQAFHARPRMGAALAIRHHGQPVVDLWGGVADHRTAAPWTEQTVSVIFSCTKGLMSILAACLVQDGRLEYGAPAVRYWPEFGAAGKAELTVAQLLAHRAGLPAPDHQVSLDDLLDGAAVSALLAQQQPLWEPGTAHAYHALTHGWLAGELIRRVTRVTPGTAFHETVAAPLQADAWVGIPPEVEPRVAHLRVDDDLRGSFDRWLSKHRPAERKWIERSFTLGGVLPLELVTDHEGFNDPRLHAAEVPGAGGIAAASALATIWSATVCRTDGVRLLDPTTVREATSPQSEGPSWLSPMPPHSRWGMGFQLDSDARRLLTPMGFGHDGAGGQLAFADPLAEVGFAFLTNELGGDSDGRATGIVDALRRVLQTRVS